MQIKSMWMLVFIMAFVLFVVTLSRSVWTWDEGDKISDDYDTFNKVTCVAAPILSAAISSAAVYKYIM
jgi:hypothetical protein